MSDGRAVRVIVSLGRRPAATERAVDLLVLGTHGRSGFEHLFLGSVTEKVIRSTPRPVLTVPPPVAHAPAIRYGTILSATDFSEASARALAYALELAKRAASPIITLHVVEGPAPPTPRG